MPGGVPSLTPPACVPQPSAVGSEVTRLAAAAADYADASQATATRRAYNSRWRAFRTWCALHQAQALPAAAAVVALYLADRAIAGDKVATLAGRLAAIGDKHRRADLAPPASARLAEIWAGVRRREAAPQRQVRALVTADLKAVVAALPATMAGARDKALLLVGYAAALRRSELVGLTVAMCPIESAGLRIHLGVTKTDQEGVGATIAVPIGKTKLCPVGALRAWLALSGITAGPIFREVERHGRLGATALSDRAAANVIKRAVGAAGFDPALFSGHSLRSGFVTAAAGKGVALERIMKQTRHRKSETVLRYIREASAFRNNAASEIGL